MWATVELTDDVKKFIEWANVQNESFEDIQELLFLEKMKRKKYSAMDVFNYLTIFHQMKSSALDKILKREKLNMPEGVLFERMMSKYMNDPMITLDEHLKIIQENCKIVKNEKIIKKIFGFMKGEV